MPSMLKYFSSLCLMTTLNLAALFPQLPPLAYVSDSAGLDAVVIRSEQINSIVYVAANENSMILTPMVSLGPGAISFAIEGGHETRELHLLMLHQEQGAVWQGQDTLITSAKNGAWPIFTPDGVCYLSMQGPTVQDYGKATDIFKYSQGVFTQLSTNMGQDRHLWPLLSPDGSRLHYRKLSQTPTAEGVTRSVRSIIYDLNSGSQEVHLIDKNIFIEQWTARGELLLSERLTDGSGLRVYMLYALGTRSVTELYRAVSWQARLTDDNRYLATLSAYPAGGPNFDIFVTDLKTGNTFNLTQTPDHSESLIGWLPHARQ